MSDASSFLQPPPKQTFQNPPRILIIGAGSRGTSYAECALSTTNATIACVCEPNEFKRNAFGSRFIWSHTEVPQFGQSFPDWRDWVTYEKERQASLKTGKGLTGPGGFAPILVDAVFVCVLDEMHEEVVCGVAGLGVSICVEKPLGTRLDGCVRMYNCLKNAGKQDEDGTGGKKRETVFGICHVLRYSAHNMLLRHLVCEKEVIGDVISLEHTEPIGWWHFTHSYVRGNWRKESKTAPSLLTKSCHDIDFIMWLLCSPPLKSAHQRPHLPSHISSTGSLKFFRRARKPAQAGDATNCLSCAHESSCIYSARKIYVDGHIEHGNVKWPVNIVVPEIEAIHQTLGKDSAISKIEHVLAQDYDARTMAGGDVDARPWFGRCVWESDNDVCDDQCVVLTWGDDCDDDDDGGNKNRELGHRGAKTAMFHMVAFTEKQCERRGRIYGSKGEVEYDSETIKVHTFADGETVTHSPYVAGGGHGGGDEGLVRQFLKAVNAVHSEGVSAAQAQREFLGCDLDEAFRSHAVVFAAEEARREGKVVQWGRWWEERVAGMLE